MKRIFWIFIVLCGLVGCTRSEIQGGGDSCVTVSAVADPSLNIKQAKASGYTIPLPDDYSYTVRHTGDQSVVTQGASIAGLGTLALMAGNYLFEVASVGEASADMPSYAGSATFSVKKGATTKVEVKAKLTSAVVEVHFSDAVKAGFDSYKATISAKGVTQTAVFDQTTPEGKLVYFPAPATEVTCTIEVTSKQGLSFSTIQTVDALAAADLLSWRIDVPAYEEKPTEPLVLELVLDQRLNEEERNFTLSLNPTVTGMPVVAGRLFDLSLPVGVKYQMGADVKLDLATKGGLAKVLLMFPVGQEPLEGCAPKGVVDLLAATPEELTAMGIQFSEGGTVGATASLLDLSAMTQKMPGFAESAQNYYATIGLLDQNGQYVAREVLFNVYGVSVTTLGYVYDVNQSIDWFGTKGLVNGTYATIKGRYNVDEEPEGLVFQYRVQGSADWQVITPTVNRTTKEVTAQIGVAPNAQVIEYALSSSEETAKTATFTAAKGPQLADMDFEKMLTGKVDVGRWNYAVTPWGYSNSGMGGDNVTKTSSYDGSVCPKIQSEVIIGVFASGGLFSGYLDTGSGLIPDTKVAYEFSKVGVPIAIRPKQLKGMYKYEGKKIDNYNNGSVVGNGAVNGGDDHFEIAVKLEKWGTGDYKTRWRDGFYGNPGSSYNGKAARFATPLREQMAVGYGQLLSGQSTDWKSFVIDIEYSQNIMPDRVIITAVSSAWGGYMTGGKGSTLYIDDLEFVY